VSRAKRARLLSQNQIREIVTDSNSDEEKYYASDTGDEEEPRPPSRQSSISQPPSPDFSVSSSEYEDEVGIVTSQQPQPSQWTMSPESRRRVLHTFIGGRNGISSEGANITTETAPFCVLRENYFTGCGNESLLPPVLRQL
jgi:hypothetical protein